MRHVKRVAARNLCIPSALIQPLLDACQDVTSKVKDLFTIFCSSSKVLNLFIYQNLNFDEDYTTSSFTTSLVDDIEESQALILNLNIAFYFTIIHPPLSNCSHCNEQQSTESSSPSSTNHNHHHQQQQQCYCNRVLYRSELVASAVSNVCTKLIFSCVCFISLSIFAFRILPGSHLKVQRSVHPLYLTSLYNCTLCSLTAEKIKYQHRVGLIKTTMMHQKSRNYFRLIPLNFESTDEPLAQ